MGVDLSGFGADVFSVNTLNLGGFGRYYFTPANQFSLFGEFSLHSMAALFFFFENLCNIIQPCIVYLHTV